MDPQTAPHQISRRDWIATLATPTAAAILLPSVAAAQSAGAAGPVAPTAPAPVSSTPASNDAGARVYNIRDFGAKGDGATLDTVAVQAAIDACARDGGGTVLVPAGKFVIGTTELKSKVTLHLAASAVLLGSGEGRDYHAVSAIPLSGDSTLGDGNWALLFAVNANTITIEGPGTIDGQGERFFNYGQPRGTPTPAGIGGNQRPYHILLHRCTGVVIRDLRLVRCAYHSIRVIQSEQVRMDGLYIHNRVNINNDGFHFISARHVAITNCTVLCQDDACALFGSCQFINVTNCTFSTRWSVFRFGGGTVRNVAVSNCAIFETYGCPIKIGAGGMQLENLSFSNIIMEQVTGPIAVNFSRQGRGETGGAGPVPGSFVRNLSFSHIRATVVAEPTMTYKDMATIGRVYDGEQHSCITLNGIGDAIIENVSFDDVHVTYAGGGSAELAGKRQIPQTTREYFGVWSEKPVGPPAYGLFARNVQGLTLQNVRFEVAQPDLRPAVVFDHVRDVAIHAFAAQGNPDAEALLRFTGSEDVLISAARVLTPAAAFLQLEGAENAGITIDGGDLAKVKSPLALRDGATAAAAKVRA